MLENVDVLIFCTGYRYEFPFLKKSGLVQTGEGFVYPVYRHIFHPRYPTLAFTSLPTLSSASHLVCSLCAALPDRILASMIAEFQSKYIARVFSGRCALPDAETMLDVIDRSVEQHKKERGTLEYVHPASSEVPKPVCTGRIITYRSPNSTTSGHWQKTAVM